MTPEQEKYKPGDVFQIAPNHGRDGWIGAFVLAEEIRPWGIQGFVAAIKDHDTQARAYIRLKWEEVEFIGSAPYFPASVGAAPEEPR